MVTTVRSLGLQGISGYEVTVECFLSGGLPAFDVVGLGDTAVKEARERVRAAVKNISLAGAKRYDAENDALPVVLLYIGKRDGTVDLLHTLTPYIISVCPWHNKIMNEP